MSVTTFLIALVLLAATLPCSSATAASGSPAWKVECREDVPASCQMYAAPETRNGAPPAFLLTVTPASEGSGEFAVITAPQRVYLVPGIEIRVDKRRPFKALFELCDDAGCHAGFKLAGPVLDAFRRGAAAKVRIWTAKDKAVEFAVSLNGFSKALEGLKRGGKP